MSKRELTKFEDNWLEEGAEVGDLLQICQLAVDPETPPDAIGIIIGFDDPDNKGCYIPIDADEARSVGQKLIELANEIEFGSLKKEMLN